MKDSIPTYILWIILFIEAVIVGSLVPSGHINNVITQEYVVLTERLGPDLSIHIHETARDRFNRQIIDTGIYQSVYDHLIPAGNALGANDLKGTSWWFDYIKGRIEALSSGYYHFLTRFGLLEVWAPYFLILLVPAISDGYTVWAIKRTNFNYSSPAIHTYSTKILAFIVFALAALFIAPFVLDPAIIPIALMLSSVLIGLFLGNFQKRI